MSERALLKERTPEELRYLKKHIEEIRADPQVSEASAALEQAEPGFTLEAFRSGVLIDGSPCRLTIGTLALLRSVRSRCIGYGDRDDRLSDYDIALVLLCISDEYRNLAVSTADDPDELATAVRKVGRRADLNTAAIEIYEYFSRLSAAFNSVSLPEDGDGSGARSVWTAPDDSWSDDVDLLAHEYGWRDNYILWEIPVVRVSKLKLSIEARRTGRPRTSSGGDLTIALLKAVEKIGSEIKANEKDE